MISTWYKVCRRRNRIFCGSDHLEIIGQALKDFGVDSLTEQMPHMSWSQIAGMRNVLAHEYLGVDMALVWEAINVQLDELRQA